MHHPRRYEPFQSKSFRSTAPNDHCHTVPAAAKPRRTINAPRHVSSELLLNVTAEQCRLEGRRPRNVAATHRARRTTTPKNERTQFQTSTMNKPQARILGMSLPVYTDITLHAVVVLYRDDKRGQRLQAEAATELTRPRPRPSARGQGRGQVSSGSKY